MSDDAYRRLADVLDALPNGFPATEDGTEIRLLEKIFSPEEAAFFCKLKLKFETPQQIAARTGRPLEEVSETLAMRPGHRREMSWEIMSGMRSGRSRSVSPGPWTVSESSHH